MRRRDWSSLVPELLQSIADRSLAAGALEDYARFRAVCVSWRSAATAPGLRRNPSQQPWLMLTFDLRSSGAIRSFYRPSDGKVLALNLPEVLGCRILGSSEGWLVLIHISSAIRLFNPLTRSRIDLPPLSTVPFVVSFEPEDLGYEYIIRGGAYGKYKKNARDVRDLYAQKVITLSREETGDDAMIVVMLVLGFPGDGSRGGGLVFARVGDDKWTKIDGCGDDCEDMLFHKGQLYVVYRRGELASVEFMGGSPTNARAISIQVMVGATVSAKTDGGPLWRWYLAEMDNKLLIVGRCLTTYNVVKGIRVFMVDIRNTQWKAMTVKEVKNLGDWMLFLGTNRALSFNASNYFGEGWKRNHIYFTSTSIGFTGYCRRGRQAGDDFCVFNLDDGSIQSLPYCHNDSRFPWPRFAWPPPVWFTPNLQPSGAPYKGLQADSMSQIFSEAPDFLILSVTPRWAFCGEETKVVVHGVFDESCDHIEESKLSCVIGESCFPLKRNFLGDYAYMALSFTPGTYKMFLSIDGRTPISDIRNFEYCIFPRFPDLYFR